MISFSKAMRGFTFTLAIGTFLLHAAPATAQETLVPTSIEGLCDDARSTAETMECLNQRNQNAQDKLNAIYNDLKLMNIEPDAQKMMDATQQKWVEYRNEHCVWESSLPTVSALKRLYELSCQAELTRQRALLLSTIVARETQQTPREFGARPRWMNVMINDYPDIYWQSGSPLSVDMDCDGDDDFILTGISLSGDNKTDIQYTIGMANNPQTGKPKTYTLSLPIEPMAQEEGGAEDETDNTERATPRLCRTDAKITLPPQSEAKPAMEGAEQQAPPLSCGHIMIEQSDCDPFYILYGSEGLKAVLSLPAPPPQDAPPDTPQDQAPAQAEE